jgi:hypothetical protein
MNDVLEQDDQPPSNGGRNPNRALLLREIGLNPV